MKILIWIGCILLYGIVNAMCRAQGIILGGLPTALMFFGIFFLAGTLCRLWDKRRGRNQGDGEEVCTEEIAEEAEEKTEEKTKEENENE